jgi:H+/Cl- antiporter ClcA
MKLPLSPGQTRLIKVTTAHWRRRALFLAGGIVVGALAVALAFLADEAQLLFARVLSISRYIALGLTPCGFALAVFLTDRYFPNAQGSGIPQAIAARALSDPAARTRLVSIRIAVGKILLTLLGLLCGASTGREGPTVQIGASVMFALGKLAPRRQPGLILAGAAAGVAAAFNTPLAGIVFAIEEMSRAFETRTSSLVIATVISAGLTSLALIGNYAYFGSSSETLKTAIDWAAVPTCGVVGGLFGGLFSRLVITISRRLSGPRGLTRTQKVVFAGLCGLAVAVCGLASGDLVYGTGYAQVKGAIEHATPLTDSFGLLKFAATLFSTISGIPGGIFAPSLSVGAGLGSNLAHFFPTTPLETLLLLGMVSYFSGVVQAPITAFVIVTEMTESHAMVVPLMAASLVAWAVSRAVCKEGIYHALAKNFLRGEARSH